MKDMALNIGVANIANFSGDSLATLFGVTSPNISTITVIIMVEAVGPLPCPNAFMKSTVATDVAVILTILLPTRTLDSSLS